MFTMLAANLPLLCAVVALHTTAVRTALSLSAAEEQNAAIYDQLRLLAESDYFSKIKLGLGGSCPRMASKCSAASCSIKETSLGDKSGYIDLLRTREAYSVTAAKGSAEVWADLNRIADQNAQVGRLLSGLRFSISTHIAAFYAKFLDRYFANPRLFQKRFVRGYKENFVELYAVLRTAVACLVNNPAEINTEVLSLSRRIIEENNKAQSRANAVPAHGVTIPLLHPNISEQVNSDNIFIDPQLISTLSEMLKPLACLSCQKCLLWGTIQLRGLRAAVKAINNMPLSKLDLICLVNAFRRVSVSMEESRWLEHARFTVLWLPLIYHYELLLALGSALAITLAYLKVRKNKYL